MAGDQDRARRHHRLARPRGRPDRPLRPHRSGGGSRRPRGLERPRLHAGGDGQCHRLARGRPRRRGGGRHALLPGAEVRGRSARMAVRGGVAERLRGRLRGALLARRPLREPEGRRPMMLVQGYAIAVGWAISFMILAFVLRGLYIALAIISLAAIQSTRSLAWALVDTVISMALVLIFFKVYDWLDPRDFSAELEADNRMLGLELEGLFIVLAAVMVGAMNFLGS